jgi:hypothetical protein
MTMSMMVPSKGKEQYTVDRSIAVLVDVRCLDGNVDAKSDQ